MNCTHCPVLANAFFRKYLDDQAGRLECIFHPTHYRKNQVLFFEGGQADHLFSLRSGLVKIVKPLDNGKERIVRIVLAGEIFGLEALARLKHPLTAIVVRDSDVCSVSHDHFFTFLRANSDLALDLVRFLVAELVEASAQITTMSFKDARAKVATFVLSLVNLGSAGSGAQAPHSVTLPVSSQEVGDLLELSPETVSRAWASLVRDCVIEKRGRQLTVLDLAALEEATRH